MTEGIVTICYANHRGEIGVRAILPKSIRFGSSEWHATPQWLMLAFDIDKRADREFALADVLLWRKPA